MIQDKCHLEKISVCDGWLYRATYTLPAISISKPVGEAKCPFCVPISPMILDTCHLEKISVCDGFLYQLRIRYLNGYQ